jgi:hypothetical protein
MLLRKNTGLMFPTFFGKNWNKCWEDMIDKRLASASQRPLPFPCLITKLIISSGIHVLERALLDRKILVFGLAQWTQSISHMPQIGEPPIDMDVDAAPAAKALEAEPSASRQTSIRSTATDFSLLQTQLDSLAREMHDTCTKMRETRTEILARQTAMEDMLRDILGRLPPPPDAAP